MAILNIGILAHVDAGKTTLTERILFETGVISSVGSVDKGTTQTDTMELERSRGITIKSAVVSFQLGDLKVNLIDTPGHSDFIAEVERSLRVLDAVVLVVSAVEGVQSQTRRLARAIREAGLPVLIFVNKIDRVGARGETLLEDLQEKLGCGVVAMNACFGLGSRDAQVTPYQFGDGVWREAAIETLAETSERMIEEFDRTDGDVGDAFLEAELRAQIQAGHIAPVYFGSAMIGAGGRDVLAGIERWLPRADEERDAPVRGAVFKIERAPSGEKIVYVRLFEGSLDVRQTVKIVRRNAFGEVEHIEERITGVDRFHAGAVEPTASITAGDIASLHGLRSVRIGDVIGEARPEDAAIPRPFPTPAIESVVRPADAAQLMQLRNALDELAEQDPLISLRQSNADGDISVRLYGEVQKEVMQETLAQDYGVDVTFGESRTICVERPVGTGEHLELMGENGNPIMATIGVRIEPAEAGSGVHYSVREMGSMPPAHYRAVEEAVYETLNQGLSGWEVIDCVVTLIEARTILYSSPYSTAGDFRKLAPLVVMQALLEAGTEVCEPIEQLEVDAPADTVGAVYGAIIQARGTILDTFADGAFHRIACELPTAELPTIEQQLPRLTRGEGGWDSTFERYEPVLGDPPRRKRIGLNPLNRTSYFAEVS